MSRFYHPGSEQLAFFSFLFLGFDVIRFNCPRLHVFRLFVNVSFFLENLDSTNPFWNSISFNSYCSLSLKTNEENFNVHMYYCYIFYSSQSGHCHKIYFRRLKWNHPHDSLDQWDNGIFNFYSFLIFKSGSFLLKFVKKKYVSYLVIVPRYKWMNSFWT